MTHHVIPRSVDRQERVTLVRTRQLVEGSKIAVIDSLDVAHLRQLAIHSRVLHTATK
jgi:hypothetical protein